MSMLLTPRIFPPAAVCWWFPQEKWQSREKQPKKFLHKGGRCSAVASLGANLLQLKPCIGVKDGKMGVGKKYRGKFPAVLQKYIAEQLQDISSIELDHIFGPQAGCDEEIVQACLTQVQQAAPFREVHLTRAGCTISSHCGRNTLGILFIRKA